MDDNERELEKWERGMWTLYAQILLSIAGFTALAAIAVFWG